MDENPSIHILLVGDTARWREQAKSVLPEDCGIRVRYDFVGAIEAIMDGPPFDLCIMANKTGEPDAGLRLVEELQQKGDPRVILYTREISDSSRRQALKLGAVVVDMEDTQGLRQAVEMIMSE